MKPRTLKIAVVTDPRFPGGTATAVAQELPNLSQFGKLEVHGISSRMFPDAPVNPTLKAAIDQQKLELIWDRQVISADLIILHNPSFLKFDKELKSRLVCQNLIVVAHENFTTPDGALAFDVTGCLQQISDAALCAKKFLAPVSDYNRITVAGWLDAGSTWHLTDQNWTNICELDVYAPTDAPRDRRGRHSRPGYEKFPDRATMERLFPAHAEHVAILGADTFADDTPPAHWTMYNFRTLPVSEFLAEIDFFIYFTNANWRESFGRVIAEATAAGKLVITDPATAQNFGDGIIGAAPDDVDGLIAGFIADPQRYVETVIRAQKALTTYSAKMFAGRTARTISQVTSIPFKATA